jgi:hypothetical protein
MQFMEVIEKLIYNLNDQIKEDEMGEACGM